MGAWGVTFFEDDHALDWLDELCTSDGTELLAEAFSLADGDTLAAPDGVRILCAGATLAVALGHDIDGAPGLLKIWTAGLFEDDIRALLPDAAAAVQRVLRDGSALKAQWGDATPQWEAQITSLLAKLRR